MTYEPPSYIIWLYVNKQGKHTDTDITSPDAMKLSVGYKIFQSFMRNYTGHGWEGSNYNGDLSTKEIAALLRKQFKSRYPGWKISVRYESYSYSSAILVRITGLPEGVELLTEQYKKYLRSGAYQNTSYENWCRNEIVECEGVYTAQVSTVLEEMTRFARSYKYDDSDGQIDYFDTNFYCIPEVDYELKWEEQEKVKALQVK